MHKSETCVVQKARPQIFVVELASSKIYYKNGRLENASAKIHIPGKIFKRRLITLPDMRFAPKLMVASMATLCIASHESSVPSHQPMLRREPPFASRFHIYDVPLDFSRFAGEHFDNMGTEHGIRIASAYLQERHNIPAEHIQITSSRINDDTGTIHVYARQTVSKIDVLDGVANVNIDKDGRVTSSSQTFAPAHRVRKAIRSGHGRLTARSDQYTSLKTALKMLSKRIGSEIGDEALDTVHISKPDSEETAAPRLIITGIPAEIAVDGTATAQESMMRRSDGSLVHVWDFQLRQADHWWNARINMATGAVESLDDRMLRSVHHGRRDEVDKDGPDELGPSQSSIGSALRKRLTYKAIPVDKQDPTKGFGFFVDPESATSASPIGWVSGDATVGNNAIVYKNNPSTGTARETSPGIFAYDQNGSVDPTTPDNVRAAIVNVFYVVNSLHDIFYLYGFTEDAYNFQSDNFGKGGEGNDRMMVNIQNASDYNNGLMTTPPDGQSPQMQLFLFNLTTPFRDSALQNDLVSHLFAEGMVNRLTGGGTANCLRTYESQSLLQGWADAIAEWLEQGAAVEDFTLGSYVSGTPAGVREYPYSRSLSVNPLTYEDIPNLSSTHAIGEVWANMLHNILAALSDNLGWSYAAATDPTGTKGNVVFMHLFIDSLSIQPCNPTFINARDAFILADSNRYNGAHFCILWSVFASRGLGLRAVNYANDFSVPTGC